MSSERLLALLTAFVQAGKAGDALATLRAFQQACLDEGVAGEAASRMLPAIAELMRLAEGEREKLLGCMHHAATVRRAAENYGGRR